MVFTDLWFDFRFATICELGWFADHAKFVEVSGGSHGILWTHAEQVNTELVKFIAS
jgi:hypothetical protein